MTTTQELADELAQLQARDNLKADEARRMKWIAKELASRLDEDGAAEVRALRAKHMEREAEMYGYADEGDTPTWRR